MIRFLLRPMLIIAPLIAWHTAWAAPSIQQINYSTLGNLEIHGNSFGSGPKVVLFDNFEHGPLFSNQLSNISSAWHSQSVVYREPGGNHTHRAKYPVVSQSGVKGMAQLAINFRTNYTEAFVAFSVKVPEGTTFAGASTPKTFPDPSSWKFTWLMHGSDGFGPGKGFDVCIPTHVGNGNFAIGGNDGTISWFEQGSQWWDWDHFNHMAMHIRLDPNAPSTQPITFDWSSISHRNQIKKSGSVDPSKLNSQVFAFDRINIPGWWGNGDNSQFDGLYDNLYVAVGPQARARVVLTDSADFSASKTRLVLMASSWTDSRIVIDAAALPTDGIYFLHVFDANNQRSLGSYRVCPACPAVPIAL